MAWSYDFEQTVDAAVRAFAQRQYCEELITETLNQAGSALGLRFALDVASAWGLQVNPDEIDLARQVISHLDPQDRSSAGIAYSIENSLKLLGTKDLAAA